MGRTTASSLQADPDASKTPFEVLETRWRRVASTHTLQVRRGQRERRRLVRRTLPVATIKQLPEPHCTPFFRLHRTCWTLTTPARSAGSPASSCWHWGEPPHTGWCTAESAATRAPGLPAHPLPAPHLNPAFNYRRMLLIVAGVGSIVAGVFAIAVSARWPAGQQASKRLKEAASSRSFRAHLLGPSHLLRRQHVHTRRAACPLPAGGAAAAAAEPPAAGGGAG